MQLELSLARQETQVDMADAATLPIQSSEEGKQGTPPYVPFRTLLTLLDKLRDGGIPHRLDSSYWNRYFSGSASTGLMTALRFLAVMPPDGNVPKPELQTLVDATGEEQKRLFADLVRTRYRPVFDEIPDLTKATPGHLDEVFRKQFKVDGDTHRKAVTFFVYAAQHAGIPISKYITDRMRAGSGPRGSRRSSRPVGQRASSSTTPAAAADVPLRATSAREETPAAVEKPPMPLGDSKTVQLPGGFTLTLSLSGSLFQLRGETRAFIFDLMDKLDELEAKVHPTGPDEGSPRDLS